MTEHFRDQSSGERDGHVELRSLSVDELAQAIRMHLANVERYLDELKRRQEPSRLAAEAED